MSIWQDMKEFLAEGFHIVRMIPSSLSEKPDASTIEVREHVRGLIDIFAPRGGFVFRQVHNIQLGVPPENIVAMLDAAKRFGRYAR